MPALHRPLSIQTTQKTPLKRRTLPPSLQINQSHDFPPTTVVQDSETPSSALSDQSEADSVNPPPIKPLLTRNRKKLSLTIHTQSNDSSTSLSGSESPFAVPNTPLGVPSRRRSSIVSLPNVSSALRRDEETSPSAPYPDGPVEVLPGVWIGTEDHARDWKSLVEKGIRAVLNVAKEVAPPYTSLPESSLRSTVSTPNLSTKFHLEVDSTYVPPHIPSGRPSMHYLRLPWSHGQTDLVNNGFVEGMNFVDASLSRGDSVLIHCQCGVSRSATMVIALVMRAAHSNSPGVPPEVHALKSGGMHASYAFVKEKSKWVGPNMSLMYQLLEYERLLNIGNRSPTVSDRSSQIASEEAEWGRRRQAMDEVAEHRDEQDSDNLFMREARALDLEMEQRIESRRLSETSNISTASSAFSAPGVAWKSRFGTGAVRSRAGSVASNFTNHNSILSEDLMEEDEENITDTEFSVDNSSLTTSSTDVNHKESLFSSSSGFTLSHPPPPPSAPVFKNSFALAPPPSASHFKTSFDAFPTSNLPFPKHNNANRPYSSYRFQRKKATPSLPPVPPSPVNTSNISQTPTSADHVPEPKKRVRPSPAPLLLPREPFNVVRPSSSSSSLKLAQTPSQTQTLFVFPPEESISTPSTLTLMSNLIPLSSTPRVSSLQREGRRRARILGPPPTPTTACSRVDAFRC